MSAADQPEDFHQTKLHLRKLGMTPTAVAQFELLTHEQKLGIRELVFQYDLDDNGNIRYVE